MIVAAGFMGFLLYRRYRVRDDLKTPEAVALSYYTPKSELGCANRAHEVSSWRELVEM
jgi:hypothetical protein